MSAVSKGGETVTWPKWVGRGGEGGEGDSQRHGADTGATRRDGGTEPEERRRKQEDDEVNRVEEGGTKGDRGEPWRGEKKLEKKQKVRWRTEEVEEKLRPHKGRWKRVAPSRWSGTERYVEERKERKRDEGRKTEESGGEKRRRRGSYYYYPLRNDKTCALADLALSSSSLLPSVLLGSARNPSPQPFRSHLSKLSL